MLEGIIPWVERHYRVRRGRENRALAGLSLGAVETVSIGLPRLDQFSYFGAFSGGLGRNGQLDLERRHRGVFKDEELTRGVRLFFVAYGLDDQAKLNARGLLDSLRRSGIQPTLRVTSGGHNWANWRANLEEFVPRLFR
jgi:enterochelin esterase-like enzyme